MIRPFDWRDLALLHRMGNTGLCMDSQLAYTRGRHALQNALLDALTPGRRTFTLIDRPTHPEQGPVFGQVRRRADQPHAQLTFIGPVTALVQPNCIQLLDALSQSAGENGAHHLIAEVEETSPAFENLRQAGFAIYARQRIWRLADSLQVNPTLLDAASRKDQPEEHRDVVGTMWRREMSSDAFAVHNLYLNLVPALVQQVEPPPIHNGRGLVHWDQGEFLGYLYIDRGPRGVWVHPYFHPAAERLDDLLAGFLAQYTRHPSKPLYICVRSYQGGLSESLDRLSFEPFSDQAVMVKRLAVQIRQSAQTPLPVLEGSQPEPTAPFVPIKNHKPASHIT